MNDFQDRLASLDSMSPDELSSLESDLVAAFDAADEASDLPLMQELADALDMVREAIRSATEGGDEEAAPAPEQVAASGAEVPAEDTESVSTDADVDTETETTTDSEVAEDSSPEVTEEAADEAAEADPEVETAEASDEDTTESSEETADDTEAATDEAAAETQEPSSEDAASNESEEAVATDVTAEDVPAENVPVTASGPATVIRAGGDIPGLTAGAQLDGMEDVIDAMTKKINAMRGVSGRGEQVIVASITTDAEVDEDRVLRPGDLEGNGRKIRELIGNPEALTPEALTAGGWCAPRTPVFDVPTVGTTRRPVQAGLPTFRADRGGITWTQPPSLSTFTAATSLWRHDGSNWVAYTDPEGDTEASPNDEKPILTIACGTEVSKDVDAIPVALTFDNLMARAYPEWVRATTELVMVGQARFAEQKALAEMFAVASTGTGDVTETIGVARDFLTTVRIAAAEKRWEHRLDSDSPLQLLAPEWLCEAIAADLGLQAPGDDTLALNRSIVDGYLSEFNVSAIWYMDDAPGTAAFSSASAFPASAHWLLFPTGSFVRLDNGELNLGVVRTKEDVQKNAYTEFSETFEAVAYMGPANAAWVTYGLSPVNLIGSHSLGTSLND